MTAFDLRAAARTVATEHGFVVDGADVTLAPIAAATLGAGARDLRALPWSSIDNDDTRDLDQLEASERLPDGGILVRLAIADVDVYVPKDSPLDQRAARNTTSVYTGIETFPMLPEQLSTDLTSLAEGATRAAIVVEMTVAADGRVGAPDVYRALVCNRAKLTYENVGAWLAGAAPAPRAVVARPELAEQLRMQDEAASRLRALRHEHGALDLETIEARTVTANGRVVDIALVHKTRARDLIEDFMIAANVAVASFLESRGIASLRRVVKAPKRWPRIVALAAREGTTLPGEPDAKALGAFLAARRAAAPDRYADLSMDVVKLIGAVDYDVEIPGGEQHGHFGLAVDDYTHSTAPNRRYADLVTQRQLKAAIAGAPSPYDAAQLAEIAARCTRMEDEGRRVEREVRKMAAASLLSTRLGETFDAVVTGDTPNGVFVRLLHPPAEGRVVRGEQGLDVGDRTKVTLVGTDAARGHIDFARA
ncbi:MAG: RNB domain-containing ribonuclease [Gemmatimonadaceae bacterium]|nr:RNB domain-containing ribonuclease [Gemmatimonadaceae bacterium]